MSASKDRLRWEELPASVRGQIENLAGGRVVAAHNCESGFSPGFASRLTLADGRRAFAKAMDTDAWPSQGPIYRDEARVAAALSATGLTGTGTAGTGLAGTVPTPRFLGACDDGRFVALAFECADGVEPTSPWQPRELARVAAAVSRMSAALTPSPLPAPDDHPRLGGWAELADDAAAAARLRACSAWAARHIHRLIALENRGLVAARGAALVHFDVLPHNILVTAAAVTFVDWPHARLGAPFLDLLIVLASAAADGIDPDPLLRTQPAAAAADEGDIDAVLTALTGFWLAGALEQMTPGLEPIAAAKLHLGRGGLRWLQRRLRATSTA